MGACHQGLGGAAWTRAPPRCTSNAKGVGRMTDTHDAITRRMRLEHRSTRLQRGAHEVERPRARNKVETAAPACEPLWARECVAGGDVCACMCEAQGVRARGHATTDIHLAFLSLGEGTRAAGLGTPVQHVTGRPEAAVTLSTSACQFHSRYCRQQASPLAPTSALAPAQV